MAEPKKLYRLPDQGVVAGVCAGLAQYFDLDVTMTRVVYAVGTFLTGGFGVLLYIILAVVAPVPGRDRAAAAEGDYSENVEELKREITAGPRGAGVRNFFGLILIVLGVWLLLGQLFPGWLIVRWDFIWPLFLVFLGFMILMRSRR